MSKTPRHVPDAPLSYDQDIADTDQSLEGHNMSAAEAAQYIAEFTAELSYLARQTKLDLLAYLLDMARLEATRALKSQSKNQ